MTITVEDMRAEGHLLTLDEVRSRFEATEPLSEVGFSTGPVTFELDNDWNGGPSEAEDESVEAAIHIGSDEYQLTRGALLQAGSAAGIQKSMLSSVPGDLMVPILNYKWAGAMGQKNYKLLTRNEQVLAVTKDSIVPFSNLRLLDETLEAIHSTYGASEQDVYADNKFQHDLTKTHVRLVVPENVRRIASARDLDEKPDNWSVGVQIRNSLVGAASTSIEGYLFAWFCTNGCTTQLASSGKWSRRTQDDAEIYDWAREAVDEVLGGLEHELDKVQSLVDIPVRDNVVSVMESVFSRYNVPRSARSEITEELVESDDTSMYGVLQAVTQAANHSGMSDSAVTSILDIGGHIVNDWGNGRVVFEALEAGENLDLEGNVTVEVGDRSIETRVLKLPVD